MKRISILRVTGAVFGVLFLAGLAGAIVVRGPLLFRGTKTIETPEISPKRLEATVRTLCGELSPRLYQPASNLARVADWIAERFRETGLEVSEQPYTLHEGTYRNVIAARRGTDPNRGVTIIGAHYDAYGPYPGADDNASGVAVLLELARTVGARPAGGTQMFVAFANEEPPFFGTEDMGSAHFASKLVAERTRVDVMIALDLVGYFSDDPGSQRFPLAGLSWLYPDRGDFIGVVGDLGSGRAIRRVKRGMIAADVMPVYSFRGPSIIGGVLWSDHFSFRRRGLPAVMITDTAFLRNPNYHRASDTPDTLDYRRMAAVVRALHGVLRMEE